MAALDTSQRILLAGLPSSGKTTFLAALWYVLTNPRAGQDGIKTRHLGADRTYLNAISEQWMRCEQVDRTQQSDRPESVELPLVDDTGHEFDLVVPDLSGELFRGLWEARTWPASLAGLLEDADGVLFFVHPDHAFESPLIEDARRQAEVAGSAETAGLPSAAGLQREFKVADVGDATQLVDILQSLERLRERAGSRPLAVVVSAWDLVPENVYATPEAFVSGAAPLVAQYLESRADSVPVRYWGVSAQGGHYPNEAEQLADLDEPSNRIMMVATGADVHHDLRAPLAWLLMQIASRH